MKIFNCKMCGGRLEINEDTKICECEYCNTKQTISTVDDDQLINMINRANYFRMQCEFDKASDIYNNILSQCSDDPEIYWSLVLCRYGIEYVDDPVTNKKVPTCHRVQYKSILEDPDYLEAIDIADPLRKAIYIEEAEYIHSVQMKILEISNKEKPFDVFICYKESDENGQRTQDSVLAQELYYGLTNEGFKVFFSRITLESKLGTEYEPYIFAALNSSPIMVVVGTRPEHFNAVWVKNEWSRFLLLMQDNKKKMIIPAYRDMNPYDLPEALSLFQAQDMSKLGFMQDLIRGIKKILNADKISGSSSKHEGSTAGSANVNALLKRVSLFLEDSDWASAKSYCNRVLDADPENALAYYYLLLCDFESRNEDELKCRKCSDSDGIEKNSNYKKAYKFGDDKLKGKLELINKSIIYNFADDTRRRQDFVYAQSMFESLGDYKDSKELSEDCRKMTIYTKANNLKAGRKYIEAKKLFESLGDYKDCVTQAAECESLAQKTYDEAVNLKASDRLIEAHILFSLLGDYKDSRELASESESKAEDVYNEARDLMEKKKYARAKVMFDSINGYKDSSFLSTDCNNKAQFIYTEAVNLKTNKQYLEAKDLFLSLEDYSDCLSQADECDNLSVYSRAEELKSAKKYKEAKELFDTIDNFRDSHSQSVECDYLHACHLKNVGNYNEAKALFLDLDDYKDSFNLYVECFLKCSEKMRQNPSSKSVSEIESMISATDAFKYKPSPEVRKAIQEEVGLCKERLAIFEKYQKYLNEMIEMKKIVDEEKAYKLQKQFISFIKQNNIIPDEKDELVIKENSHKVSQYLNGLVQSKKRLRLILNIIGIVLLIISIILHTVASSHGISPFVIAFVGIPFGMFIWNLAIKNDIESIDREWTRLLTIPNNKKS